MSINYINRSVLKGFNSGISKEAAPIAQMVSTMVNAGKRMLGRAAPSIQSNTKKMPLNMNLKTKRPLAAAPYQPAAPVPTPASTPKPASSVAPKNKPIRNKVILGDLGAGKPTAKPISTQPAASPSQALAPAAPKPSLRSVGGEPIVATPVQAVRGQGPSRTTQYEPIPKAAPESAWGKVKRELKWAIPVTGVVGLGTVAYAGLKTPQPLSQGMDQQRTYY